MRSSIALTVAASAPGHGGYRYSEAATFKPDRNVNHVRAFVGDDGRFQFETAPTGEYVLAVNSGRDDAYDDMGPAFFYPSVLDLANATRLRIGDGLMIDVGEAKAPTNPSFRVVDVQVVDAGEVGHEASLQLTSGRDGREFYLHTDASGRSRLWLRPGLRFRIEAKSWNNDESGGDGAEISADGPLPPLVCEGFGSS